MAEKPDHRTLYTISTGHRNPLQFRAIGIGPCNDPLSASLPVIPVIFCSFTIQKTI